MLELYCAMLLVVRQKRRCKFLFNETIPFVECRKLFDSIITSTIYYFSTVCGFFIFSETVPMRDKERVHDYRFMAEPNLPPLRLYTTATLPVGVASHQIVNIDVLARDLPELPSAKRERLQRVHGLSLNHSSILVVSL